MRNDQLLLVENDLINAVRAFHDLDDKEKRETYVREYTLEFCQKNGIDVKEAIAVMNKYFEGRRNDDTPFNYDHYKGKKTLEKIILSDKLSEEQILMIECDLIEAISAFHEISDPNERAEAIKEYTSKFCAENKIKPKQALPIVKKFFAERAKNSQYKYEHYKGRDTLKNLMMPDDEQR